MGTEIFGGGGGGGGGGAAAGGVVVVVVVVAMSVLVFSCRIHESRGIFYLLFLVVVLLEGVVVVAVSIALYTLPVHPRLLLLHQRHCALDL